MRYLALESYIALHWISFCPLVIFGRGRCFSTHIIGLSERCAAIIVEIPWKGMASMFEGNFVPK